MSARNLNMKLYNVVIGKRNERLRAILVFTATRGSVILSDLKQDLGMNQSSAQTAVQELTDRKLIAFTEEAGIKGVRNRYTVLSHTEADLDAKLPINRVMALAAGFTTGTYRAPVTVVERPLPKKVVRDPLDIMLMGHGPAPSLLFRNTYAQAAA